MTVKKTEIWHSIGNKKHETLKFLMQKKYHKLLTENIFYKLFWKIDLKSHNAIKSSWLYKYN